METERSDFDAILPGEISSAAVRTGNEWLIPLAQAKEAIGLATKHRIAVLGVEVFRVDGLITEGYSGYEFQLAGDWGRFVSWNNEAALQYVVEHEFGSGYGYTLTTTSAREFEALKGTMSNNKSVIIKIKRQLTPDAKPSWEEFEIAYKPNMNVTSALMEIAAKPVTRDGKQTTPVTYDSNCLEEVCGSCAMLINGRARMACSALIDHLDQPIKLEPFSKFSVVRDLSVDRSVIFENLKKVKAWVPVDGTYDLGSGPRMSAEDQEKAYPLSRCISCCCCMEACPQFNEDTGFVGAATISQVRLFNTHPTGQALKRERLSALMGDGGIQECGYAQNCVEICPKDIPLTTSIAEVGGQVMKQAFTDLLRK